MISIVTPTYNSGEYLEECINSIMNQPFEDYEHIIMDGGSTDDTLEILKKYEDKYNMKWVSEKDNGMYDAIRKGFELARGDILCWINSDDYYMPWTLKTVYDVFNETNYQWITGINSVFDEGTGHSLTPGVVVYPRKLLRKGWMDGKKVGCVQQESTFWKASLYKKVGGLDTSYTLAGDYDLWARFAQHAPLITVNSFFANFRRHNGQKSEDIERYWNEIGKDNTFQKLLISIKVYKYINAITKRFLHRKIFYRVDG